jgi:hypothetical protein
MVVVEPMLEPTVAKERKGTAKIFAVRNFVMTPGTKIVAGRVAADSVVPVYSYVAANSPDFIFHISFNGQYIEISPRYLYLYGFICPATYICTSKYDDSERIYNVVMLPKFEMGLDSVSVEFLNPTATSITIYDARVMFYVMGKIYDEESIG